ncbi:MAG: helix-turn-helix domain-containing protein [Akkermansiaceae bacterium]
MAFSIRSAPEESFGILSNRFNVSKPLNEKPLNPTRCGEGHFQELETPERYLRLRVWQPTRPMSFQLVKQIIEDSHELSDSEFRVLVTIANFKNRTTGRCNPSLETVAGRVKMQRRSVRRIAQRLKVGGFLSIQTGGRSCGDTNQYDFPRYPMEDSTVPRMEDRSGFPRGTGKGTHPASSVLRTKKEKNHQQNKGNFGRRGRNDYSN